MSDPLEQLKQALRENGIPIDQWGEGPLKFSLPGLEGIREQLTEAKKLLEKQVHQDTVAIQVLEQHLDKKEK